MWQCINATENGKKHCPHSKGIEEEALKKIFMESYRKVCHENTEVTKDFLKTVEEELKSDTLSKEYKKISGQLEKTLKQEKALVDLRLSESISLEVYQEKYHEVDIRKEQLLAEKRAVEVNLSDENALKKRLEEFKRILEKHQYLESFDRAVFESIVDKIIVGGINEAGDHDPAMITILYKTGLKDNQDGKRFKSRRKNAREETESVETKMCSCSKDEADKSCLYPSYHACGDGGSDAAKRTEAKGL